MRSRGSKQKTSDEGVLITNAVYVLAAPTAEHKLDIVFMHGLQHGKSAQPWRDTWSSDGMCWPEDMLAKDFPNARVLSLTYNTTAGGKNKVEGTVGIAGSVLRNLTSESVGLGTSKLEVRHVM